MAGPKKLLMLGGNRYHVRAIQVARQAGFVTLVADRNPHAPGLACADVGLAVDLRDVEALASAVERNGGADGVVAMTEAGVEPAAELSHLLGLTSIAREAAANATSKAAMRRRWADLGRYSLPFEVVMSEEEAVRAADRLGPFPLIFKPDRSFGGSRGVSRVESREQVAAAFHFARSAAHDRGAVVVEPWVGGTEHSAEVLIWHGRASLLCVGQKVKSDPPYRVDVSVQYPAPLGPAQEAAVARMCQEAVAALGLTLGPAHVEFALTPEGPVLFELAARCGGGHTPLIAHHVSGVDEFLEYCRMACGLEPAKLAPTCRRGAEYRFLVFPAGRLEGVNIPHALRSHPQVLDVDVTVAPGEVLRDLRTTADRAGFVVALADDRAAAIRVADWACGQVTATYADGRAAQPRPVADVGTAPVLDPADADLVVRRYQQRIQAHGPTLASLNSGSAAKQAIRHEVHGSALRGDNPSVLDVGCGLAQLYDHLRRHGRACRYTGYDIVPEYVRACRERFPEAAFHLRNLFVEGIDGTYDTIILSQVLNNRYASSDNMEVVKESLRLAYDHARLSVSIDLMSSYVDYQDPELFYYAPEEVFRFAKTIARRVLLRHDYRPFEFCIQLFRPEAAGYVP